MTIAEVAGLLGYTPEKARVLVTKGVKLPKSGKLVKLASTKVGRRLDVSDKQFDAFVKRFDAEEPGRWSPAAVRREPPVAVPPTTSMSCVPKLVVSSRRCSSTSAAATQRRRPVRLGGDRHGNAKRPKEVFMEISQSMDPRLPDAGKRRMRVPRSHGTATWGSFLA